MNILSACELAEKTALRNGADEAEAYASLDKEIEVFIERNDIKVGKAHSKTALGIRIFRKKAAGFAATNDISEISIEKAVSNALGIAKVAPTDRFNTLPSDSKLTLLKGIYDKKAESFGAKDALENALLMMQTAKDYDRRITVDSGAFNTTVSHYALCNSNCIEVSERISTFSWAISGMAVDGSEVSNLDYQTSGTHKVKDVNVEKTAKEFAANVVHSLGAKRVESFKGSAIFSPNAVAEVIASIIVSSVNANSVQKGMSKLSTKLGKKIANQKLTIIDDGTFVEGLAASSFDREGVPHRPLQIVEKGVLKSFMYNTYTATKDGVKSTGHAIGGARGSPSVGPTNIIMSKGRDSLDSIIGDTKKGLLVTRFSGNVSSVSGDFSGVVKGGFLIENGGKKHPVKETLIAGNVFERINNIQAVSEERKTVGTFILPYLCVGNIPVTAG